jgi:mannose-6-phosphate isomerase-like protein (cupin superfamily)
MLIRNAANCAPIRSADDCLLHEYLHPAKEPLRIRYSLARAELAPGQASLPHRLRSAEVYCILAGRGVLSVDDGQALVKPGDAVYIPPESVQSIRNQGPEPLVFLCIVDPPWREEDEEIL